MITINPNFRHGMPTLNNSQTLVTDILREIYNNNTIDSVAKDYSISKEDVEDCIAYAITLIETIHATISNETNINGN